MLEASEVRHVMKLARLSASDADVERLRGDLSTVLGFMERLNALDVEKVEPMTHGDVAAMRLRADESRRSEVREAALSQAPQARDGHFAVPRVVGGEETP